MRNGRPESGKPRRKEVAWYDPATLVAASAQLPGRAFMQALADGELPPPPMGALVGLRLASVGDGESRFLYSPDESASNPQGVAHGGLVCTLLDFAAGAAVQTRLPAGVGYSSIEIKVSFLKAIRSSDEEIEIRGEALRVGRQVAFAQAHARNERGELVGHAPSSLAVHRP